MSASNGFGDDADIAGALPFARRLMTRRARRPAAYCLRYHCGRSIKYGERQRRRRNRRAWRRILTQQKRG